MRTRIAIEGGEMSDMAVHSRSSMVDEHKEGKCYQSVQVILCQRLVQVGKVNFGGLVLFGRPRRVACITPSGLRRSHHGRKGSQSDKGLHVCRDVVAQRGKIEG